MRRLHQLDYIIKKAVPGSVLVQPELVILYLLEGKMEIRCYEEKILMKSEDIFLLSPGMECEFLHASDVICGTAFYSPAVLSKIMRDRNIMLYADSARDMNHSYSDLREILQEMTKEYTLHTHETSAYMDSLMLKLLDCLIEKYQVRKGIIETGAGAKDVRMRRMMQYITRNLNEEISLTELAKEMYVSASTLSRIFKKNTGYYFADYVMHMRIRNSLPQLQSTEQTITQVALNSGFSSSAAFNRSFKKTMGMMPTEYRKNMRNAAKEEEIEAEEDIREELIRKGYQYGRKELREEVTLDLPALRPQFYDMVWNECINIGDMFEMGRANTQFHVLYLQEHLHFKYVRLWNIFSVKMMISDGSTYGQYNFDLVNQILDFLVQNRIRPFLDLARRPDTAIRSEGSVIYFRDEYIPFASRRIWEDLLEAFLLEIVNRYGIEEVSTWIFELCHNGFHSVEETRVYEDPNYDYFEVWKYAYTKIRKIVPGARFGGPSAAIGHDEEFVSGFLKKCVQENCRPDYVSFMLFPYEFAQGMKNLCSRSGLEPDRVRQMKQLLSDAGMADSSLYITEWNNSIGNRNYLNDSCYRSAYLVSCIASLWSQVDMLAVMAGTDWVSNYFDSNKILNGGIGLIAKDMICKPAYFAFSFLRNMGRQLLAKDDHFLLSRNANGDLFFLCFHFSWLREDMIGNGDDIDLQTVRQIRFADERKLELNIRIKNPEYRGEYIVKRRVLGENSGSILNEWAKLGFETRLNREDIKYLQAISVPGIGIERIAVNSQNCLDLTVTLQPQEVILLHLYPYSG